MKIVVVTVKIVTAVPEDIPPTANELLVVTFGAVLRVAIEHELKGILSGAR